MDARRPHKTQCALARRLLGPAVLALLFGGGPMPPALAQVGVPRVNLPDLPVDLPVDLGDPLPGTTLRLNPRELRNVRLIRVRELLRQHRDVIEADPRGAPMLRSQVLAFSPSESALQAAKAAGFSIVRERVLEGLSESIVVLRAPPGMSTRRALKKLRNLDPQGAYDFNHVYTESGEVANAGTVDTTRPASDATQKRVAVRIGLIDGGVDLAHPVFHAAEIHTRGCEGKSVASRHGTAVASLLVGSSQQLDGAAPGAVLYAADVYCGLPIGGSVDAIADAIAWLARERVPTINVSLVGPPNILLERTLRAVISRGHVVVAAVGNDGPSAPPLYPAAYPGVIGVTGVDGKRKALLEACRGSHVDFAAPGADMAAAGTDGKFAAVRGTSFAAPIVAGLIAMRIFEPAQAASHEAIASLAKEAVDLGKRGPDRVYGNGLVGEGIRSKLPVASLGGE